MLKRLTALLLCLCLLPAGALAEGLGVNFTLTFDIDASAYPADVQELSILAADLLNHLSVEGSLQTQGDLFDLDTAFTLYNSERTRTEMRLYGTKAHWLIDSPLTGHEKMYIFLDSMLEFAIKGHTYMDIPFQRAAVLLSPYVHENGLSELWAAIKPVLFSREGERTVSRGDLLDLAWALSEASGGRPFRYWAAAVGRETGYEDVLLHVMSALPEWAEYAVTDRGLQITVKDGVETWTLGHTTVFESVTAPDGGVSMTLSLPELPDGYAVSGSAAFQPAGDLMHGSVHLHITDAESNDILHLEISATLPTRLPVIGSFFLSWKADGAAVIGGHEHHYFEGESNGNTIILRQMTPDLQKAMMTLTLSGLSTFEPLLTRPEISGVSLLSVSSDSLSALVRQIAMPMLSGLLPILAEMPASTCQRMMDLLENSGIFGLLTGGFSDSGEDWDSFDDGGNWDLDDSDAPYVFVD